MSITLDYKSADFDQMLFSFYSIGDRPVFECFPVLKKYKEFSIPLVKLDINKVMKYIGYAYDKGSPLQKIEDIVKKKVTAALLAGFIPEESGVFKKEMDAVFKCQNLNVNLMIIRYCRLVRSRAFMVLSVGNETLYNSIKELMSYTPSGDDKLKEHQLKIKLLTEAKNLADDLDKTSVELLSGDNSHSLNNLLYAVSDMKEEEYIELSPEDFADKWSLNHPEITSANGEEVPVSET